MISPGDLAMPAALVAAPCIAFIETFRALPFGAELTRIKTVAMKSFAVIGSSSISDHWKERVVPRYSLLLIRSTFLLGFYLLLCVTVFAVSYLAVCSLLSYDLEQSLPLLVKAETQVSALLVSLLYFALRSGVSRISPRQHSDYSSASGLLHHLALNYRPVRELAFDLDCALGKKGKPSAETLPPVFVTGLARGGTTLLLEALFSSGQFMTLTYRNMPFVTAPSLWPGLSARFYRSTEKKERAHGDRLKVGFDSPEAFEEVFWLTFGKEDFVRETSLAFQDRDEQLEDLYRKFVDRILAAAPTGQAGRYLAKNNNNLLRIDLLEGAFPDAIFLVPFRNPADHAHSLLKQHRRFCKIQQETPFALKYMNWLGHHEFGLNFKPFEVAYSSRNPDRQEPDSFDYWLIYWAGVYERLLERHADQLTFVDYDAVCASPEVQLEKLASRIGLDREKLLAFAPSVLDATRHEPSWSTDPATLKRTRLIHKRLVESAL